MGNPKSMGGIASPPSPLPAPILRGEIQMRNLAANGVRSRRRSSFSTSVIEQDDRFRNLFRSLDFDNKSEVDVGDFKLFLKQYQSEFNTALGVPPMEIEYMLQGEEGSPYNKIPYRVFVDICHKLQIDPGAKFVPPARQQRSPSSRGLQTQSKESHNPLKR